MVEVNIDAREIHEALVALQSRGMNLQPLAANFAQTLLLMVEDEFASEGRGRWPALSPVTIARRRASKSPKMLQDTGDLVGSLQPEGGADNQGFYSQVFTNKSYAQFHLEGKGVPKRDFFDIDIDAATESLARQMCDILIGDT